jgi:hypothetical protein
MHTMDNNAAFKESNLSLLNNMKDFFNSRFDKMDESNNMSNIAIAKLQASQEIQYQIFTTKLENTTKNLTTMIDNVASSKGIKSGKYVTRSTIAKSILLNATKITKALTEPEKLLAEYNKENEQTSSMETDPTNLNSENQHEAMAIVTTNNQ